jgi:hypothetical protein
LPTRPTVTRRGPPVAPADPALEVSNMSAILRRSSRTAAVVLVLGLLAVALVEAGIAIGADRATSGTAPSTSTANAAVPSDPALAADLDALLAADQTAAPQPAASAGPVGAKARINAAVRGLRRLAAARKLIHATVVADLPKLGGITTIQLDHGTISAVSATSLSVGETGGSTARVKLGDETRVRRDGARATVADLKTGDEVFVMSRVESDGTVAYLVVVPAI